MLHLAWILLAFSFSNQIAPSATGSEPPAEKSKPATLVHVPEAGPGTVTIPAGTKVPLELKHAISTKSAQPGDGVYLQTSFPVTVDNRVVIPPGTYVQGVITDVKRPGKVKGRAELLFHFTTLIFPNGYTVSMPGALENVPGIEDSKIKDKEGTIQAEGTKGRDAATIGGTTATGALIGLSHGAKGVGIGAGIGAATGTIITLLTRGNDLRLEAGTTVEMVFQRPLVLEDSRLQGATGAAALTSGTSFKRSKESDGQNHPVLTPAPDPH